MFEDNNQIFMNVRIYVSKQKFNFINNLINKIKQNSIMFIISFDQKDSNLSLNLKKKKKLINLCLE